MRRPRLRRHYKVRAWYVDGTTITVTANNRQQAESMAHELANARGCRHASTWEVTKLEWV
jgi:hypothetical protein